jgi:outer membrane protein, heavy metal efflux system
MKCSSLGDGRRIHCGPVLLAILMIGFVAPFVLTAQEPHTHRPPPDRNQSVDGEELQHQPLDSLLALVLATHPDVQGAQSRAQALESRVPQAGALPDPTFSFGLMNLPLPDLDLTGEGMSMVSLQLSQTLPPRGLRGAREASARAQVDVARAQVDVARWQVTTRLQEAYFELLLVDQALEVHHQAHSTLEAFASSAESAYTQGLAPQQDILRAHTELAAIEEHLAELRQRRSVALAEANSLLGRNSRDPIQPDLPSWVEGFLAADPGPGVLTSVLTNPELGGGLPTLRELQEMAIRHRPELTVAREGVQVAQRELEVARHDRRPGIAVTGGYGIRSGRADVFSAGLSVDLPLFRGRKQDEAIREAEFNRDAQGLDVAALERSIQEEVARAHADLIRAREQVILLEEGVIPQARAAVESSAASYRAGEAAFVSLMEVYAVLFRNEIELAHLTAGLGQDIARLEQAVGTHVVSEDNR